MIKKNKKKQETNYQYSPAAACDDTQPAGNTLLPVAQI
jgi:hypothetical protein